MVRPWSDQISNERSKYFDRSTKNDFSFLTFFHDFRRFSFSFWCYLRTFPVRILMIFDHFNNDRYENISTFDRRNLVDSLFWFLLKEGNFTFFDVELFILFFNICSFFIKNISTNFQQKRRSFIFQASTILGKYSTFGATICWVS